MMPEGVTITPQVLVSVLFFLLPGALSSIGTGHPAPAGTHAGSEISAGLCLEQEKFPTWVRQGGPLCCLEAPAAQASSALEPGLFTQR